MSDFARLRLGMVDGQIRVADVTDHRILAAFLKVPREKFMPEGRRELAYLDTRVPLGGGRAMLDPMILARLIQLADPQEDDRVLVVGAGLAAAARTALAGEARVDIVEGPLTGGAPSHAPYDLIFCEGAVIEGLETLAAQLAPGGRLVAPSGRSRPTKATVFRRNGDELGAAATFDASAATLPGFEAAEAFAL